MSKPKKVWFKFKSKLQALAFIHGVEYVNDSSLAIEYRGKALNGHLVLVLVRV